MLFVKKSSPETKKDSKRYNDMQNSGVTEHLDDQQEDIKVQDIDEQENDDYGYVNKRVVTNDKGKFITSLKL